MPRTAASVMTSQAWEGRARTTTTAATMRSQKTALMKKELGIRDVPPRDVRDVRREVKRILLGDVKAVCEREQPDPGSVGEEAMPAL